MSIREVVVTPSAATELLDRNLNNRRMSVRRAAKLADAMTRGEWQYNGDTIRISKTGRLLDGQHRLKAIEISGIPQKYIIVDGLEDEAFTTIDVGSPRSAYQMLDMAGEKNTTALAAVAKMVLLFRSSGIPLSGNMDKQPTHSQVVDFAEADADLKHSVSATMGSAWIKRYVGPSVSGFCHYMFGQDDDKCRDDFFKELASGDLTYINSPVKYMRELFIEERGASYTPDKLRRTGLMFRAFKAYKQRRESKIVRLPKDQSEWFEL